jgi:hypothetical protein
MTFFDISAITTVGAVIGALVIIIGGIVAVYKIAKRVEDAIGVDENGKTVSDRLSRVEHQLWPNGGDSLADQVKDLDTCAKNTSTQVELIRDLLVGMVHGQTQGSAMGRASGAAFGLATPKYGKKTQD